jgi:hypothetical protein
LGQIYFLEIAIKEPHESLSVLAKLLLKISGFRLPRLCRNSKKCHKHRHADESRYPELTENTGFRVALRLHGMTKGMVLAFLWLNIS